MLRLKTIAVTLSLSFLIFYGCGNKASDSGNNVDAGLVTNPISATGKPSMDKLPVMTFEQTKHDFGMVVQGEKVEWTFRFTNTGGSDLVISQASSTCNCTVPDFTKEPVKPGGQGTVEVVFNSAGRSGSVTKSVSLLTNAQPNTVELEVSAEIYVPQSKK